MESVTIPAAVTGPTAPEATPAPATPAVAATPAAPAVPAPAAPAAPERPAWLPEKFATAEQMAASYTELEKKMGVVPAAQPVVAPASPEAARALLTSKELDTTKFVTEFQKDGKLSDASYTELASKGISKEFANDFIAGQQARAEQTKASVLAPIGGQAEFDKAVTWARSSLTADDIQAFNRAVRSGGAAEASYAVQGLYARYRAANPAEPALVRGGPPITVQGYASTAQMVKDMQDPRYKKDPAFRSEVEAKVKAAVGVFK